MRITILCRQLEAKNEIPPAGRADLRDQLAQQRHPSIQVSTEPICAPIAVGREKLMKQVPVAGGNFDTVETGALETKGGGGECFDHTLDRIGGKRMGHGPCQVIRQGAWRESAVDPRARVIAAATLLKLGQDAAVRRRTAAAKRSRSPSPSSLWALR